MPAVESLLFALMLITALGCGLVAGVFFAFSSFVMKALARLPAQAGIGAMQAINVVVLRSWFMAAFLGTAVACVLVVIASLWRWGEPGSAFLLVGGALYLVGSFLVTIVFNVPKNEALASVVAAQPDSGSVWTGYVSSWTAWTHVRTAASLAAAAALSIGLAC